MLAVQIPRIVFGGIVSIVCVLHKSAYLTSIAAPYGSSHAVLFRHYDSCACSSL